MAQKIIFFILFLAFINFQFGCRITNERKLAPDDTAKNIEIFSNVVLKNGDKIEFEDGGFISEKSNCIMGVSLSMDSICIPLSKIQVLRIGNPDIVPLEDMGKYNIIEVITDKNLLLKNLNFSQTKPYYSYSGIYNGNTISGKEISFLKKDIKQLRTGKVKSISIDDYLKNDTMKITEVILNDDKIIMFRENSSELNKIQKSYISGWTKKDNIGGSKTLKYVSIDLDKVLSLNIEKTDVAGSIIVSAFAIAGIVIVVGAGILLIIEALKESCPFVYSFDGKKFVFDAEPLGGATVKSMAKTDFSKLEFLKPANGKYQIMIRNEVDETQYIDHISLVTLNHSKNTQVIKDESDKFYQISYSKPPFDSRDERQQDLSKFFGQDDGVSWQTHLSSKADEEKKLYRHSLTFKFIKPKNSKEAKFIVHAGTSLWGSYMIKEMYELWGSKVDDYIRELNEKGKRYLTMMNFIDREELFKLKVYVQKDNDWIQRGVINGGGPFIYESQLLKIKTDDILSDTITLQVRPPVGYWSFDYIGINFEPDNILQPKEISINTAIDEDNRDVKNLMLNTDENYYCMPTKQNFCKIDFNAPIADAGKINTLFLKCNGYYDIHFSKKGEPDIVSLKNIVAKPGYIIDLTYKKFLELKSSGIFKGN